MCGKRCKTPPEFRGAPTWEGRLILALFGGLWLCFGLFAIVYALATVRGADLIAPLYAGALFLGVGLVIWMPAFPRLVNHALRSKNRLLLALWPHRGSLLFGGLFAAMGLFPVLSALNVIPSDHLDWPAPRWVGGIAGGMFLLVGICILAAPWVGRQRPQLRRHLGGLLPLLIFSGFAAIADWIAFGAGTREFGSAAGNGIFTLGQGGNETIGRIVFGLSGLFLTVASLVGWWRYLRGKW